MHSEWYVLSNSQSNILAHLRTFSNELESKIMIIIENEIENENTDVDMIEPLRKSAPLAPLDFTPWLEKHLDLHDPMLRPNLALRDETTAFNLRRTQSFKCWDERCAQYVYGFATQHERDAHVSLHQRLVKRDSGFSAETSPTIAMNSYPFRPVDHTQSLRRLPPFQTAGLGESSQLPPISPQATTIERDDMPPNYTVCDTVGLRGLRRNSADAEVEPLLPPLKRSRPTQPRLESIGELFRDTNPCLRCRIDKRQVHIPVSDNTRGKKIEIRSSMTALDQADHQILTQCGDNKSCFHCSDTPPPGRLEHWGVIGCFRNPLNSFAVMAIPGKVSSSFANHCDSVRVDHVTSI